MQQLDSLNHLVNPTNSNSHTLNNPLTLWITLFGLSHKQTIQSPLGTLPGLTKYSPFYHYILLFLMTFTSNEINIHVDDQILYMWAPMLSKSGENPGWFSSASGRRLQFFLLSKSNINSTFLVVQTQVPLLSKLVSNTSFLVVQNWTSQPNCCTLSNSVLSSSIHKKKVP